MFIATLFTLTSHSPYIIPKDWQGRLPKGTLAIHESIGYTDAMLREFFTQAERQPWYRDTVFIITGDHTSLSTLENFSPIQPFQVPIVIFSPGGQIRPRKSLAIVQHADVLPTVVDIAGVKGQVLPRFGQSMLRTVHGGQAVNRMGDSFWLLRPERLVLLDGSNAAEVSTPKGDYESTQHQKGGEGDLVNSLKAQVQYFTEGMARQKIYE